MPSPEHDNEVPPPTLSYSNLQRPLLATPLMRSGPYLVTAARATLPPVCPICGKPSNGKNVLRRIAVMKSFSMRKMLTNVDLEMSFCGWHDRVRRTAEICQFILTGTAVALGIGLLVLETTLPSFRGHWWLIAGAGGLLSLVIGGVFGVIATRGPRPYRVERDHAILRGVHPNLLDRLPSMCDEHSGTLPRP